MNYLKNKHLISFLFFYYIVYIFFFIFSFKEYSWIGYFHHDQGYLLEQLILKITNFNSNKLVLPSTNIVSDAAEYGVEFFYLKFFIEFLNYIFDLNLIQTFYLISILHVFAHFFSLVLVIKIFNFYKVNKLNKFLFIFLVIFSPFFFIYIGNLKPDLNLVLLFIVLNFYYLNKFIWTKEKYYFFLTIIFLAIASSIKIWGFLLVFQYFYLIFKYKNYFEQWNFLRFYKFIILINFIYLASLIIKFSNYYLNYLILKFNSEILNILTFNSFILFCFIFALLIIIFFVDYLIKNKLLKLYWIFLNFFLCILLLIGIPFYFNINLFLASIFGFANYTNLNVANLETNIPYFFSNLIILDKENYYFSITTFLVLVYLFYEIFITDKLKDFSSNVFFKTIFIFIIVYILFLSLFIGYSETWPGKFLLSFFIYFLFFVYFNHNRDMFLSSAISLTIFSIVFFSQNYQYKNIFYYFNSYYKKIENEVIFLNSKLSAIKDKYNLRDYYVFDCGGFFPYNDNNLNFFKKNKKYCKNNSVLAMKKAIFIFKKNNTDKGELELFENINNFHMDYIQFEKFNIVSQKKNNFDGFYFYFKMP